MDHIMFFLFVMSAVISAFWIYNLFFLVRIISGGGHYVQVIEQAKTNKQTKKSNLGLR